MEPLSVLERFYLNNCRKIFNKFLETSSSGDVTLMSNDGTCVKCHRFVLSACSPFFDRTFTNVNKANNSSGADKTELVVVLATYKSKNVQRMVDYIYHGKLADHPSDKEIDDDFIRLANELKVVGLYELLLEKRKKHTELNHNNAEIICRNNNVDVHPSGDSPSSGLNRTANILNGEVRHYSVHRTENCLPDSLVPQTQDMDIAFEECMGLNGVNGEVSHPQVHCTKNGLPDNSVVKTTDLDMNIVPDELNRPVELLKSSPEYNNWMRRLSNVRKRVAAKNQTLRDKKPQELLNEIMEGVKYSFLNLPRGEHKCLAKIEGQCFAGKGASQQAARLECVKVMLKSIFNIAFDQPPAIPTTEIPIDTNGKFGDIVECLILDKYRNIMIANPQYMGYKVIAGIVKSVDNDRNSLKVISIGTGSKFLYEKNLNANGNAVHDTHAEVVARRGFIRYIYNQIAQHIASNASNSIFEKTDANEKFRLKSGIKFHLYVSTAPCGDARVHSHANGKETVNGIIPAGQLRTKGQCALTVAKDAMSSANIPNVNMSCSAKILRWNVLGVQGAMLTELIEPIYMTSMIFGEKFDPKHMKRALFGRIESDAIALPKGFHITQPELMKVSVTTAKSAAYSPNHSVNWNVQEYDVEILESTSGCTMGRDKTKRYSRIARRAFFNEFTKIAKKLNQSPASVYSEAKRMACDYQVTKSTLFQIFENNGLGTWVQKRQRNLDNFTI